ncbi:MAG: hypothetical protein KC621_22040 [Myxococcales bacterium]|nr:hypothetical protein [Myxococcales bacterium]
MSGVWRSGDFAARLVRTGPDAPDQRVYVDDAPTLSRFLFDVQPMELHRLISAFHRGERFALAASPDFLADTPLARRGWVLDPRPEGGPNRFELWSEETGKAVEGDVRLLALCLELYARNALIPFDHQLPDDVPPWVVSLRDAVVDLVADLTTVGLARLEPALA